jgi:nucleotide-binding universal stress UspA family protein
MSATATPALLSAVSAEGKSILEYSGASDKQLVPVHSLPALGTKHGPQNIMVLVASLDRLAPLDAAVRAKRHEDSLFIAHGVHLWNRLQSIQSLGSKELPAMVTDGIGNLLGPHLDIKSLNQHLKDEGTILLGKAVQQAKAAKKGENIMGYLLTGSHSHKHVKDLAIEFARQHKINHIFIGDHDGSFQMLGSFSDYISKYAPCDVTLVKSSNP